MGRVQLAYVCHSWHIPHTICNNQQSIMHYCCLCRGKSQAENTVGGGYVVKLPSIGPTWQWQPHLHVLQLMGATKQTTTLQCSKKLPKIIQQSKRLGGGHSNRRFKEGQRGIYLQVLASCLTTTHYNQHRIIFQCRDLL